MKSKGLTLVEVIIASVLVLLIVIGFSMSTIGFSGVVDGSFNDMTKSSHYTNNVMLAQEMLSDKITAVKQEYNNPIYDGNHAIASHDKDVFAEQTVKFRNANNKIAFNAQYVNISTYTTTLIENIELNLGDVELKYKPIVVNSENSLKRKGNYNKKIYYAVGDGTTTNFKVPELQELKLAVYKAISPTTIAEAVNVFLPLKDRKYAKPMIYDKNVFKIIGADDTKLVAMPKFYIVDAANTLDVEYHWYRNKDVTYNVPKGNYYSKKDIYSTNGLNVDDAGYIPVENIRYSHLFPPELDYETPQRTYDKIADDKTYTASQSVKIEETAQPSLFSEFFGYNMFVTARPTSKQFAKGLIRRSPTVYIAPKYMNNPALKYCLNASWIDVRTAGSYSAHTNEINSFEGKRLINKINNQAKSGENIDYNPQKNGVRKYFARLRQPDSSELYMRSRYISTEATFKEGSTDCRPEIKFPLDSAKKYQVFVVARNKADDAEETVLQVPVDGSSSGTGIDNGPDENGVFREGEYYYAPFNVGIMMPFHSDEFINSWYFTVLNTKFFYLDGWHDFERHKKWFGWVRKNIYAPNFVADWENPRLDEIRYRLSTDSNFYKKYNFRFESPNKDSWDSMYQIVKKNGQYCARWKVPEHSSYRIELEWKRMEKSDFNPPLRGEDEDIADSKFPAYTFHIKDKRFFDFPEELETQIAQYEATHPINNDTDNYNVSNHINNNIIRPYLTAHNYPPDDWYDINSNSYYMRIATWKKWEFWSRDIASSESEPPEDLFRGARRIHFRGDGLLSDKDLFYAKNDPKDHAFEYYGRFEKVGGKYYFNWDWRNPFGSGGATDLKNAATYKINLEPQGAPPDDTTNYWRLEYQEVANLDELNLGGKNDCDIAEILIFEGDLADDYKRRLIGALRQKYAPINAELNIRNYPSMYIEDYKQNSLFTLPAAIDGVEFDNGKYGMAAIEFDDPDAVLNTVDTSITPSSTSYWTKEAHIKGEPTKKVKVRIRIVD